MNVKRIEENIINIGNKCANFGSEVFISSILIKRNTRLNSVTRKINDKLQELCKKYKFNFMMRVVGVFYVMMVSISQIMVWIF